MGYITSVLIRYERIGKYHHNYVLFFCKDMDKTMNLMLFCWILVCFNMFLVNICKRCYYLATGALTSCARFCVVERCRKKPHSRAVPASLIYIRKIYLTTILYSRLRHLPHSWVEYMRTYTFLQLILHKSHTINLSNLLALLSHKLYSNFLLALNKLWRNGIINGLKLRSTPAMTVVHAAKQLVVDINIKLTCTPLILSPRT